ncbi:MAG: 2-amino-4-hydroxy-6-hydroxymethyldihydropteridine diphosphokinase [Paludibacteraceae bacterium]|nr:2-amino-4-hydroxy-6-hydroxymethyldihydropteridine diphosphokinase [Paludibacteraceae bacterium]MBP5136985.1 2-amino-4-hydroxy-6-hydroxymethyldihydropteridine diphosphokinase [Paludibacteraceae bacterium]MBP5743231.1 2-amino-4-hydroxy-6-hydroxymethyldihydropteridine diphosphokinase [Paludibacteraceae bacterium]
MGTRTYAYLGIGSNIGDRFDNLQRAVASINERLGEVVECSRVYDTEPMGFESSNRFLNAVIKIIPKVSPGVMLKEIKDIETQAGRKQRKPGEGYSDRCIDIDILLFGSRIHSSKTLTIPHEKLAERIFVLKPLVDIAPNLIVPGHAMTTIELLGMRHDFDTIKPIDKTL